MGRGSFVRRGLPPGEKASERSTQGTREASQASPLLAACSQADRAAKPDILWISLILFIIMSELVPSIGVGGMNRLSLAAVLTLCATGLGLAACGSPQPRPSQNPSPVPQLTP